MSDKIFKKIHDDGSETVIKQVRSAFRDEQGNYCERDETVTSIFISSSVGCPKKCVFCHLTEMEMPFKKLSARDIAANVDEAIDECTFVSRKDRFKLCWMGMGDPLIDTAQTILATNMITAYLMVIEVDISTIVPDEGKLGSINRRIKDAPVRIFYSLHSGNPFQRDLIIPRGGDIENQIFAMNCWEGDKFIHYTPIKGLNDSLTDALSVLRVAKETGCSIRMLEFNPHPESVYERPSIPQLNTLYKLFQRGGVGIKWQVSKGKKESASCGMFTEIE
jgi:23S rRNA (adenine2503-C2)-methyltransferase